MSSVATFYQEYLPPLLKASDADTALRGAPAPASEPRAEPQPAQRLLRQAPDHSAASGAGPGGRGAGGLRGSGFAYTDLRDLGVHGRAFNDTAAGHYFSRLPASAQHDVTDTVWQLSLMSTNQHVLKKKRAGKTSMSNWVRVIFLIASQWLVYTYDTPLMRVHRPSWGCVAREGTHAKSN